jgi:hypothetical protein
VPDVKCHQTPALLSGKFELGFVCFTQVPLFAGMPGVLATLPQRVRQDQVNVFVKIKPHLHAALASTGEAFFTCLRQ